MKTEGKIQQEIVMYFRNNYCLNFHNPKCLIFSVPNESSSKGETMRKLATGLLGGVSDLIVILPNKVLFFECKDDKGTQSDSQKQFQKDVQNLGFEYHLVRSLEDFRKIIQKHVVQHKKT